MNKVEQQYLDLIKDILENGNDKDDRTGTGTMSLFGRELRHDFKDGFPLFTTRQISLKTAFTELKWFLLGRTDLKWLLENNCKIWVGDFYKDYKGKCIGDVLSKEEFCERILNDNYFSSIFGNANGLYGDQWRKFNDRVCDERDDFPVDQISNLIDVILSNPDSRRLMVTAWNPTLVPYTLLPPCHYGFQIYTRKLKYQERFDLLPQNHKDEFLMYKLTHKLTNQGVKNINENDTLDFYINMVNLSIPQRAMSLKWNQRSGDTLLGIPTNIISYSMLLMMLCKKTNMIPQEVIGSFGYIHIYKDQISMAKEILTRQPYQLPTLTLSDRQVDDISEYDWKDFSLSNYQHHPKMFIPLSN